MLKMDTAGLTGKMSELPPAGKKQFISTLKTEFIKSPLVSNVFLGLILAALEKLVEMEFSCPCKPSWNALFASAYFILPGVIASVLMLSIQGCKINTRKEVENCVLFSFIPAAIWLVLLFLDGKYYACAKTSWSGQFVFVDKAAPQRWCEPNNSTLSLERLTQTQQWYFQSQAIGLLILILCTILLATHKCLSKKQPYETARSPQEPVEEEEMDNFTSQTNLISTCQN